MVYLLLLYLINDDIAVLKVCHSGEVRNLSNFSKQTCVIINTERIIMYMVEWRKYYRLKSVSFFRHPIH